MPHRTDNPVQKPQTKINGPMVLANLVMMGFFAAVILLPLAAWLLW